MPLLLELARSVPGWPWRSWAPTASVPHRTRRWRPIPPCTCSGRFLRPVPGFLQHADVVIVPHQVNAFTESLDPIKAYECLAAGRPTVSTPVAGFRGLGAPVIVADRAHFVEAVAGVLDAGTDGRVGPEGDVPSWRLRAEAMAAVMDRARTGRSPS